MTTRQPAETAHQCQQHHEGQARQRRNLGHRDGVVDGPGQRVADRVDAGAIVVEQHAVAAVATRKHLPERAPVSAIDPQQQFGADRPRCARCGIDRRAAPPVDGKRDRPYVRRVVLDRAAARERGRRIAVGDERQRRVVEHDVHENRPDLRAIWQTDGPAGVQQHLSRRSTPAPRRRRPRRIRPPPAARSQGTRPAGSARSG